MPYEMQRTGDSTTFEGARGEEQRVRTQFPNGVILFFEGLAIVGSAFAPDPPLPRPASEGRASERGASELGASEAGGRSRSASKSASDDERAASADDAWICTGSRGSKRAAPRPRASCAASAPAAAEVLLAAPLSAAPPGSRLHKTVLCRHWSRFGSCYAGSACGFAHGKHELRELVCPSR